MVPWQVIVTAVLAVFTVVGAGVLLRWLNWLTEEADQTLMAVIVRVLMPFLIVQTMLGNAAVREAKNVFWPPLIGAGTVLLGFMAAWLWGRAARGTGLDTRRQRGTFVLTVGLYNYVYIPLPLIALMFPSWAESTMGVLFVHNVGVELVMWTVGVLVLSGGMGKGWWKRLVNPPSVAVVAALVLNYVRVGQLVPGFVMEAMRMLGGCAIPLALLLVGAMVSDQVRATRWGRAAGGGSSGGGEWRVIGGACLLRLGILPAAFLVLAKLLPVSVELKHVMVLQAAMPAAMFPVVMAKYYQGDAPTAVRVVGATSVAGLATIPMWLSVGMWWIG